MICLPTLLQPLIWSANYVVVHLKLVISFWNYVFLALTKPRTNQCQACLVRLMALLTNLLTDLPRIEHNSSLKRLRNSSVLEEWRVTGREASHLGVSDHSLKIKKNRTPTKLRQPSQGRELPTQQICPGSSHLFQAQNWSAQIGTVAVLCACNSPERYRPFCRRCVYRALRGRSMTMQDALH